MTKLSPEVAKNVDHWSSDLFDESTRSEIKNLENNQEELEDRFYKNRSSNSSWLFYKFFI